MGATSVVFYYYFTFYFQGGYLLLVAGSLVARTYCDVWMIHNGTSIERSAFQHKLYHENLTV